MTKAFYNVASSIFIHVYVIIVSYQTKLLSLFVFVFFSFSLISYGGYSRISPKGLIHYANKPMQYTAIFHGCKNVHVQVKFFNLIFFLFLLKALIVGTR